MKITEYLKIEKIFYVMLLFIPLSLVSALFIKNMTLTFIFSILAIVPLARIVGYATKEIAIQTNPTISGLISATFGNIIELIIAVMALMEGLLVVVKASIVGSILGNILLLTGLSIFAGGLKYKKQRFNKKAVGVSSTMLIIAVAGLSIPSIYNLADGKGEHLVLLSDSVAIVLAVIYVAGLIFTLKTHRDLFDATDEMKAVCCKPNISIKVAAVILLVPLAVVAVLSELLVSAIAGATSQLGMTETFIGIVIIAIITNIAEKASAINFALENKIDISIEIGNSSAIQIALFVVPILVLISAIFNFGFLLEFTLFEVIAMFLAVMIVNYLSADGECNWLEGAQLVTVYALIAIAFFFV